MNQNNEYDELEGDDSESIEGWGDYPLDAVFVRTEKRTVVEIIKRIQSERFIMDPDFQRDFLWDISKQSRLIESCLMRIPLPVFYVAENEDGRIIVVDGLQRLTTLNRYLNNDFALNGLGEIEQKREESGFKLTGNKFCDLPIKLKERIEDTQLTLYILESKAPERAKLDIFERVNSGVPLTRQQMRNSLFTGPATKWLKNAAKSNNFIEATNGRLNPKQMRDREAINRFCAFRLFGTDTYKGDMDKHLANALIEMNKMNENQLEVMMKAFTDSMINNYKVAGKHAFRKSMQYGGARSVINISLFDVLSVVFAEIDVETVESNKDEYLAKIRKLLSNYTFNDSITSGTNSSSKVNTRYNLARSHLLKN